MALYRADASGNAPKGLSVGDEVLTGGGTYKITGVNADGTYQSALANKTQTTYNYAGQTATRGNTGYSSYTSGKLGTLEGGYTPSGSVTAAKAYLQQVQSSKPGAYQSRWDEELTSLYDQITNRKPFQYDLGEDALYQQYKEQYQRLGRQAMEDTMGQAASLTGGYGSTYSQQVGQQAYNAYLQSLNDIVPDLYDRAYSRYQDEGQELYNRYSLVEGRENMDYSKYRDTVSDYYNDLSDARSAYNSERSFDYQQYSDQLSYWSNKAAQEQEAYLAELAAAGSSSGKSSGSSGGSAKSSKSASDSSGDSSSSSSGLVPITQAGSYESNTQMGAADYKGVRQTITTLLAQGNYDRVYTVAEQAQPQMSPSQWRDIAQLIYERSGQKIDDSVKYN